ncbi:hypothetical protein NDU88_007221 [Pleurodeles waltl]|uniref:Uncharacterized protein n=1 Tax=Pleurodeles waltl TaxID=8319 RepID=A0AAV7LRE4_PLEWA|nr:hypothetical protein NDU88_007221 [Pleurodeles waltl]
MVEASTVRLAGAGGLGSLAPGRAHGPGDATEGRSWVSAVLTGLVGRPSLCSLSVLLPRAVLLKPKPLFAVSGPGSSRTPGWFASGVPVPVSGAVGLRSVRTDLSSALTAAALRELRAADRQKGDELAQGSRPSTYLLRAATTHRQSAAALLCPSAYRGPGAVRRCTVDSRYRRRF